MYSEESFGIIIPFQKRTDVLINGFQYYDTTTKKVRNNRTLWLFLPSRKIWFWVESRSTKA